MPPSGPERPGQQRMEIGMDTIQVQRLDNPARCQVCGLSATWWVIVDQQSNYYCDDDLGDEVDICPYCGWPELNLVGRCKNGECINCE